MLGGLNSGKTAFKERLDCNLCTTKCRIGEKVVRVGGWSTAAGTQLGWDNIRKRTGCGDTSWRGKHTDAPICRVRVGYRTARRWWVVTVVSSHQAVRSSVGVPLMSLTARSNMRWVHCPLWDLLFGSATSALLFVCVHT